MKNTLLEQFGVYPMFGYEISNNAELGLEEDKIYNVLKDGDYVRSIAIQLGAKDIPIYDTDKNYICDVQSHTFNDGLLFIEQDVADGFSLASLYLVDAINESGDYIGVNYDLKLINPDLKSIHVVERKRERIPFPEK